MSEAKSVPTTLTAPPSPGRRFREIGRSLVHRNFRLFFAAVAANGVPERKEAYLPAWQRLWGSTGVRAPRPELTSRMLEFDAKRWALERLLLPVVKDPPGSAGVERVLRGGSVAWSPVFCRSAFRHFLLPGRRYDDLGFRVLLVAP